MIEVATESVVGDGHISIMEVNTFVEYGILLGTAIVSAFGAAWLVIRGKVKVDKKREKTRRKKERDREEKFEMFDDKNINLSIYEKLLYIRIKTGASRARICLFHNGGKFLTGAPMQKFSCTHETSGKGVSNESEKLQNCFTTVFLDKMEQVKKNDPKIHVVEELELESKSKFFYKSTEVNFFAILPLYKNDLIVGFIEVEWNEDPIPSLVIDFSSVFTMVRSQIEFEMMKQPEEEEEN